MHVAISLFCAFVLNFLGEIMDVIWGRTFFERACKHEFTFARNKHCFEIHNLSKQNCALSLLKRQSSLVSCHSAIRQY